MECAGLVRYDHNMDAHKLRREYKVLLALLSLCKWARCTQTCARRLKHGWHDQGVLTCTTFHNAIKVQGRRCQAAKEVCAIFWTSPLAAMRAASVDRTSPGCHPRP